MSCRCCRGALLHFPHRFPAPPSPPSCNPTTSIRPAPSGVSHHHHTHHHSIITSPQLYHILAFFITFTLTAPCPLTSSNLFSTITNTHLYHHHHHHPPHYLRYLFFITIYHSLNIFLLSHQLKVKPISVAASYLFLTIVSTHFYHPSSPPPSPPFLHHNISQLKRFPPFLISLILTQFLYSSLHLRKHPPSPPSSPPLPLPPFLHHNITPT